MKSMKILFLIQWQWKPYVNCHCTENRIFTIPPAPAKRSKQAWQTCWSQFKAHKYVEYRQKRNSWNKPAVNKWCGNENFGDECKSLLYFYLYFAPLKWFNARDIYRDSSIHVRLEITRFKENSSTSFWTKASVTKMLLLCVKWAYLRHYFWLHHLKSSEANRIKPSGKVAVCYSYDIWWKHCFSLSG